MSDELGRKIDDVRGTAPVGEEGDEDEALEALLLVADDLETEGDDEPEVGPAGVTPTRPDAASADHRGAARACASVVSELLARPGTAEREIRAADAVMALADGGDGETLRRLLDPGAGTAGTTWSVACYELGAVTPASVQEFDDPLPACSLLRKCGEASHAAAELIVSTKHGEIQWAAVTRTLRQLRFQLPTHETCRTAPGTDSDVLFDAIGRWQGRVRVLATDSGVRSAPTVPAQTGSREEGPGASPTPMQVTANAVRSALAASLPHIEDGVAAAIVACEEFTGVIAEGLVDRIRGPLQVLAEQRGRLEAAREALHALECHARAGRPLDPEALEAVRRQVEHVIGLMADPRESGDRPSP